MYTKNKLLTMYRVACLYYNDNLSQNEIAKLEGTSRSQISHLLIEARKQGIVEINVRLPQSATIKELENKLCDFLGIQKVYIAHTKESISNTQRKDIFIKDMATSAASLLPELLKHAQIIGIGRGQTIFNTSLHLPYTPGHSPKTFVPLVGDSGNSYGDLQTSSIVNRFATQFCSNGFYINSASFTTIAPDSFQEAVLLQLNKYWNEMDAAVLTVGSCTGTAERYKDEDIPLSILLNSPEILTEAKGELFGCPYSNDGEIKINSHDYPQYHFIGIPLDKLRRIENVICIACSAEKIQPLITAAKLGYYKTLIIDRLTAEEMLSSADYCS